MRDINGSKPTNFPLDESKLPFEIPCPDRAPRENLLKLGTMTTNRIGLKTTVDDPEYWGLDGMLTDEMVDVALKMGVRKPKTIAQMMKLTKMEREPLEKLLDEMSWLGLLEYNWENLDGKNPGHEKRWVLPLFVPGSAEFLNMRRSQIDEHPEVAAFFERMTFLPLEHITAMVPPGGAGIGMHVIPVEKAIETENQSVDVEHISHWLKKYDGKYAAGPCSCRMSRPAGQNDRCRGQKEEGEPARLQLFKAVVQRQHQDGEGEDEAEPVRLGQHPAVAQQIFRDRVAQLRAAVVRRLFQQPRAAVGNDLAHEPGQRGIPEAVARRLLRGGCVGRQHMQPRLRLRVLRQAGNGADIIAAARLRREIALVHQLLIRAGDCGDAHMQMLGQRPLGRQLLPGQKLGPEDILPDAGVEPVIFRLAAGAQIVGQHAFTICFRPSRQSRRSRARAGLFRRRA